MPDVAERPDVLTLDNFIGGRWVKARATDFFEVHNPAIGAVIGRTPLSTSADVDAAVQAAVAGHSLQEPDQRASLALVERSDQVGVVGVRGAIRLHQQLVRRGDIWRVDLGPEIGEHSALLVSRTGSMRRRWRAVIALITSEAIGLPTEVRVGPQHGLERDSAIDCEDLYTVSSDLLTRRTGELDQLTQDAVDRALHIALGLAS